MGDEVMTLCSATQVQNFDGSTRFTTICSEVINIDMGATSTQLFNDPEETEDPLNPGEPDRPPITSGGSGSGKTFSTAVASLAPTSASSRSDQGSVVPATVVATSSANSGGGGGDGLSNGAVAGIAIGTAIAGAAIAFLIAFLLFRRKNRRGGAVTPVMRKGEYESTPELQSLSKGIPGAYMSSLPAQSSHTLAAAAMPTTTNRHSNDALAGILPPPADQSTISSKFASLFSHIHHHVESFYRDVHASITPSMEEELGRFGMEDVGMAQQLQSSSSPTVAVKHALVAYVLGITRPDGEEDQTLFPTEIVGAGQKEKFASSQDLTSAYTLYKRLAVYLHTSSNPATKMGSIREAAEHFALTFFPWANPGYGDHEKEEDLVQIITNTLDLVVWLYGQPGEYEFVWDTSGRRGTTIAPGLVRMEHGEQGSVLLEPAVIAT